MREEAAVRVERHLGRREVVAALRVAEEMLGPVGRPVHRPADAARPRSGTSGYSRNMKILVPKPPPTSGVTTRMRSGATFRIALRQRVPDAVHALAAERQGPALACPRRIRAMQARGSM